MNNWFKAAQIGLQVLAAIAEVEGSKKKKFGSGDVALYVGCRTLVERLEERNPGIERTAGYTMPVSDLTLIENMGKALEAKLPEGMYSRGMQ